MAWCLLKEEGRSACSILKLTLSILRHAVDTHLHQKKFIQGHRLSQLREHQLHQLLPATLLERLPKEECWPPLTGDRPQAGVTHNIKGTRSPEASCAQLHNVVQQQSIMVSSRFKHRCLVDTAARCCMRLPGAQMHRSHRAAVHTQGWRVGGWNAAQARLGGAQRLGRPSYSGIRKEVSSVRGRGCHTSGPRLRGASASVL